MHRLQWFASELHSDVTQAQVDYVWQKHVVDALEREREARLEAEYAALDPEYAADAAYVLTADNPF